jgi:hypothetical protein
MELRRFNAAAGMVIALLSFCQSFYTGFSQVIGMIQGSFLDIPECPVG